MKFTTHDIETFHRDGYVVMRTFFSKPEVDLLYRVALDDDIIRKNSLDRLDAKGLKTKLAL